MNRIEKIAQKFLQRFKGNQFYCAFDYTNKLKTLPAESIEFEELTHLNEEGYCIFFAVNEVKGSRRKKDNVSRVRAVWIDDDKPRRNPRTNFPLPPSITVRTSRSRGQGKYQYYWLTDTTNFVEFEQVMQCMIDKHGSDKGARDLARVLRIPGFSHMKNKANPCPVRVTQDEGKAYGWDQIKIAFPPITKHTDTTNEQGTFDEGKAMDAILSGKNYHGAMCSIALATVNRGESLTTFKTMMQLAYRASGNKRKEFKDRISDEHLGECYNSALAKVEGENVGQAKKINIRDVEVKKSPIMPENPMEGWPDPWTLIWEEWSKIPRVLNKELLVPTIIAAHAYLLSSNYVNSRMRRPNMAFLILGKSTVGKDINSADVIEEIDFICKKGKADAITPFSSMINDVESITSDTAFIEAFDEGGNLFWMNTEATTIFDQLASSSNTHVKALGTKIVQVVNGGRIKGKNKAGKNIRGIKDPNCQVIFYTQPETVTNYLTGNMVDSGFLGRMITTCFDDDVPRKPMGKKETYGKKINENLIDFYMGIKPKSNSSAKVLAMATPSIKELNAWGDEMMLMTNGDDHLEKVIDRMGITAEQLYCTVLGIAREYSSIVKKEKMKRSMRLKPLLPLLTYWAKSKKYVIETFVNETLDPLADEVVKIMKELISGKLKVQKAYAKNVKEFNAVPFSQVWRVMQNRRSLIARLKATNDSKNVKDRAQRLIANMEATGEVVARESKSGRKTVKYYGFLGR